MTTLVALAVNIGLSMSGFFAIPIETFGPVGPCDEAMMRTPGLFAEERKEGDGPEITEGKIAVLNFRIVDSQGITIADSRKWGVPRQVRYGKDEYWTPVLWKMRKGERRRVSWSPYATEIGHSVEVELVGFHSPVRLSPASVKRK